MNPLSSSDAPHFATDSTLGAAGDSKELLGTRQSDALPLDPSMTVSQQDRSQRRTAKAMTLRGIVFGTLLLLVTLVVVKASFGRIRDYFNQDFRGSGPVKWE